MDERKMGALSEAQIYEIGLWEKILGLVEESYMVMPDPAAIVQWNKCRSGILLKGYQQVGVIMAPMDWTVSLAADRIPLRVEWGAKRAKVNSYPLTRMFLEGVAEYLRSKIDEKNVARRPSGWS